MSILHACRNQPNYDVKKAHITSRIKDSIYFSIDETACQESDIPLMLPSEKVFRETMMKMDVRITDTIVCYDSLGMLAAPRISWMLRAFGAKNVHVLNGCLYQWKRDQLPISQGQQDNEAFARKR